MEPKIKHNQVSEKKYCTIKRKKIGNNDFSTMKKVKEYTTFSQYKTNGGKDAACVNE